MARRQPAAQAAAAAPPLRVDVAVEAAADVIVLFGVRYALASFRLLSFDPVGTVLTLTARADGVVTLATLRNPDRAVPTAAPRARAAAAQTVRRR